MAITLDNFVRSVLSQDATAADNQLVLALAAAPLRDPPAASAAAPGVLILQDAPTAPTKIEVIRYTGRTIAGGNVTLTGVTRGLEGTTAQAWAAGTPTFQGWTAGVLSEIMNGTAAAALRLANPRMVSLSGVINATGVPFDGTADLTLATTIADGALTIAKTNGLQTALNGKLALTGGTLTGALTISGGALNINRNQGDYNAITLANASGVQLQVDANGNSEGNLRTVTNHPLTFYTNNALRLSLDAAAGNATFYGSINGNAGLHVLGGTTAFSGQGSYIAWNRTSGFGEMDFINHHGGGSGGWYFYDTDGTTYTNPIVFSAGGNASFAGTIQTNSNSTSALVVNNGGNLRLVAGAYSKYLRTNPSNGNLEFVNNAYNNLLSYLTDNGVWVASDFQATSDLTAKSGIKPLRRGVAALKQMPPIEYTIGGKRQIGYGAQHAQQVIPEAVSRDPTTGLLQLSYGQVSALLGDAILEVEHRLSMLEAR